MKNELTGGLQAVAIAFLGLAVLATMSDSFPVRGSATLTGCANAADGTPCDDGNACTIGDTCQATVCLPPASFAQAAGSPFSAGLIPRALAGGDVNGDGRLDLVVADYGAQAVMIFLGNGVGGFILAGGSPAAVGAQPISIAMGDMNGDGKPDLAVANFNSNNVSILLGNGAGGFSSAAGSPVPAGTNPRSIAIGDTNGDGKLDLAVLNFGSNDVSILLGNGAGGFGPAAGSPVAVGTAPVATAIGDVNGDGKLDLAVANNGSNDVTILLGNGAGGFGPAAGSPVAVGSAPTSVVMGNIDADGKLDLAVTNFGSNNATILLGNGAGGFSPAASSPVPVGNTPGFVAAGDFNADGRLDLAVTNYFANTVTIMLGNGSGAFRPVTGSPLPAGTTTESVVCGDLNGDGRLDLAVTSSGSADVTILLNSTTLAPDGIACDDGDACTGGESCRAGACVAPVPLTQPAGSPFSAGTNPNAVAAGDLNGDGKLDLALANYGSNNVTVLIGNGSGGFSPAAGSPIAAGSQTASVAIGDWNGDGKLDLAAANIGSGDVTILLGNGAGAFSPASGSPVAAGNQPVSVAAGDVNGDGRLDLAVANYVSNNVTILLGNGSGGFAPASGSPIAVGISPISVKTGDLNGDGRVDLAVANQSSNTATILLGNGSGGFVQAAGSPLAAGLDPRSVALGDVNGDGKLDLAFANSNPGVVTILLGNGAGGFNPAPGSPVAAGNQPVSVAVVDANGDGKLDLAVADFGSSVVTILLGKGNGAFIQAPGPPPAVGTQPSSVAVGDVNADGKPDLAVASFGTNNVAVLLGRTCPTGGCFTLSLAQPAGSPVTTGTGPFSVAIGDWNGDGKPDAAVANYASNDVSILLGNGSGGWTQAAGSPVVVGQTPDAVASGDLNGDGKLDLLVADYNSADVTILLGNGSGGFVPASGSPVAAGSGPRSIAPADVNGDGRLDFVVANYFSNTIMIFLGNGAGGFSPAAGSPIAVGTGPAAVAIGDIDLDGRLDVAIANFGTNDATILLGNGSGGFSQAAGSPVAVGTGPETLAIADLNNDGKLDLATADFYSGDVVVLLGNGQGGFAQAAGSPHAAGSFPVSIAVGDLNGDGTPDLATTNNSSNNVTLLLGDGSGGFTQPSLSPLAVGANPRFVAAKDVNGDGRIDLVVANFTSNGLTILLNHTTTALDGTSCDDGNPCTAGDACGGGACFGSPITAPPEVAGLKAAADKATYSWLTATYAARYDVVRGSTAALPVGPGGGDEVCFDNLSAPSLVDGTVPGAGTGFWYLSRGENACGNGTYGQRSNGAQRITTTCP